LHKSDVTYWGANFKDLLSLCELRAKRTHLGKLLYDQDIRTKCNELKISREDGKCKVGDDWKICGTWDKPYCNSTSGECSESSANAKLEYSIPTAWKDDKVLEYCFPKKETDLDNPTQEFVEECRSRFLLANRNWPQEQWYKKLPNLFWETSKVQDFFDLIKDEDYDTPSRNWNIDVKDNTGDIYITTYDDCVIAKKCFVDANSGTTDFVGQAQFDSLNCTKVQVGSEGFNEGLDWATYTANLQRCRGTDDDKVFDTNDYPQYTWPEFTQEQIATIGNP